jgi:ribonuclease HI
VNIHISSNSKVEESVHHQRLLAEDVSPNDLIIYTDGSQINESTGAGVIIINPNWPAKETSYALGKYMEVYDAEVYALEKAFSLAADISRQQYIRKIWFFTDNEAAIARIGNHNPPGPGQFLATSIHKDAISILTQLNTSIEIRWVPGHQDIWGNERADALAKKGTELTNLSKDRYVSISHLRRASRNTKSTDWYRLNEQEPNWGRSYTTQVRQRRQKPDTTFKTLNRDIFAVLIRFRIGHGFFGSFLQRKGLPPNCECGAVLQSPKHLLLDCPNLNAARKSIGQKKPNSLTEALISKKGITYSSALIKATGIGTRKWYHDLTNE